MNVTLTQTPDGNLWHEGEPVGCHIYLKCDRQAVALLDCGPVLGTLPACQRCADRQAALAAD